MKKGSSMPPEQVAKMRKTKQSVVRRKRIGSEIAILLISGRTKDAEVLARKHEQLFIDRYKLR